MDATRILQIIRSGSRARGEASWNGRFYATKRGRPIFVEEPNEIVGVIVYVYLRRCTVMRITYESEVDALYIRFLETTVTTQRVAEGMAVDYAADGRLAGIEILDARKRFGDPEVFWRVILEDIALSGSARE
ncbi:MAG: hypothetical protein KatS3mg131_2082 [Candidatus Tectimicrobiota bacterium]|nr:MAG: hypothetical protein KatS3mg131_2082 [Candidatus Tectomicrobia bacterium]